MTIYRERLWASPWAFLATALVTTIDHVGIETNNILWSRQFYESWFGFKVEHRVGWKTSDYVAAKSLGEKGMEAAMPGARYWN